MGGGLEIHQAKKVHLKVHCKPGLPEMFQGWFGFA